jgi:hypothetical protein
MLQKYRGIEKWPGWNLKLALLILNWNGRGECLHVIQTNIFFTWILYIERKMLEDRCQFIQLSLSQQNQGLTSEPSAF